MLTLAERLQWAMERAGVKPAQLARARNVKPPSVSDWLNGKTKSLKFDSATLAAAVLHVNARWLADGKGPRLPHDLLPLNNPRVLALEPPAAFSVWPFPSITTARWSQLPLTDRQRVESFAEATIQAWEARHGDKSGPSAGAGR